MPYGGQVPLGAPVLRAICGVEVEPHANAVLRAPLEGQVGVLEAALDEWRRVCLRLNEMHRGSIKTAKQASNASVMVCVVNA